LAAQKANKHRVEGRPPISTNRVTISRPFHSLRRENAALLSTLRLNIFAEDNACDRAVGICYCGLHHRLENAHRLVDAHDWHESLYRGTGGLIMYLKDYQEAMAQAQANANRTGKPWYVFRDQLGRHRAEPTKPQTSCQEVSPKPESPALRALDSLWEGGSFGAPGQAVDKRRNAKDKRKTKAKRK
jgi:hypothetical protein